MYLMEHFTWMYGMDSSYPSAETGPKLQILESLLLEELASPNQLIVNGYTINAYKGGLNEINASPISIMAKSIYSWEIPT